jgi:tetratricopeptide (TPR) repeat protein
MAIPGLKPKPKPIAKVPLFGRWDWLWAVVLAIVLIAVYFPALQAGFTWDDDDHFTNNKYVASPDGLSMIWGSAKAIYYPLTLTTWWILRRLVGLEPFAYHLVTLLFHAANVVIFAAVLRALRIPGVWFAAAVFALHPMQVESVAWATELKNTQSGFFLLLSVLAFTRWEERMRGSAESSSVAWKGSYVLGLLAFLAAVLSKPSTVPLPGVLLVLHFWRAGALHLRVVLGVIPYVLLAGLSAAWTIWEQKHHSNAKGPEWDLSVGERFLIAGRACWHYLGTFAWPQQLIFIYPRWNVAELSLLWLAAAGILPSALGAYALATRRPWAMALLAGGLIYGGFLFPVMGFFNIYFMRFSFVADHFAYLALLPLSALVGAGVSILVAKFDESLRPVSWAIATLPCVLFALLSFQYSKHYHDEQATWRETVRLNPNAWIGWNNLGYLLAQEERYDEALEHLREAIRLKPDYEEAYNNTGFVLLQLGQPAMAIAPLREAMRHRQPYFDAMMNLANAYAESGNLPEGLALYEQLAKALPEDAVIHKNRASLLVASGRRAEAVESLKRAAALDPSDQEITARLAMLLRSP